MERTIKPLNDFAFKKAMGEPGDEPQLLSFLNAVLAKTGKGNLQSVEIMEYVDLPARILDDKYGKLDVLARLENGTQVNIEVQLKNEQNIEKRTLYYWGNKYARGIQSGDSYNSLLPVITINIIDFHYFDDDRFHLVFHLWEDENKELRLTDDCEIHFLDMTRFRKLKTTAEYRLDDPILRWLTFFDEKSPKELIEEVTKMDPAILMARNKLEVMMNSPELLRTYEAYEKTEMDMRSAEQWGIQQGRQDIFDLWRSGVSLDDAMKQLGR